MISDGIAAALHKRGIHYGWVVAGTTFLVMLATAGAMGSAGVLIQPLQKEFGWTTEQISGAFAIRLVFFGLLGPFAAAFMNHFGIRKVVTAALLLIASGIGLSLMMRELWRISSMRKFASGTIGRRPRRPKASVSRPTSSRRPKTSTFRFGGRWAWSRVGPEA